MTPAEIEYELARSFASVVTAEMEPIEHIAPACDATTLEAVRGFLYCARLRIERADANLAKVQSAKDAAERASRAAEILSQHRVLPEGVVNLAKERRARR